MKRNSPSSSSKVNSPNKHLKRSSGLTKTTNSGLDEEDLAEFQKDLNRVRETAKKRDESDYIEIKSPDQFETVLEAILYLRTALEKSPLLTNRQTDDSQIPPVIWRHHLYYLFSNPTKVDTELRSLCEANQIRILCVATSTRNADLIIQLDDFCNYFIGQKKNLFIELFISKIVKRHTKSKYTLEDLNQAGFGALAIDKFMNLGLLTGTDTSLSERQLSIPGLGTLIRALHQGRKALLGLIRKSKYSQILQSELLKRSVPKCLLGMELHLYDILGADLVNTEQLANDVLLRVIDM